MTRWRIHYGDGTTWEDDPRAAPPLNVQCIVQADDDPQNSLGRVLMAGFDFYWWEGQWFGSDLFGLFDYLERCAHAKVLFGRSIGSAHYRQITNEALERWDREAAA